MTRQWKWIVAVLSVVGASLPADGIGAEQMQRTISVQGEGVVSAPPDMAEFQAGVVTEADSAASAVEANNKAVAELMKVLRDQQIAAKDIQTTRFDISPRYRNQRRGESEDPKIIGYTATNQVRVRVRNLPELGKVLDAVVQAGSNQIHSIQFAIDNKEGLLNQARTAALRDAKSRAELYAQAAGVKVGNVLQIQESGAPAPQPRFAARAMMAESSVPVAAGEQDISASLQVVYELVD